MSADPARPTLISVLAWDIVSRVMEKPLLGEPYFRFFRYFEVALWLYTTGAVLGRARHDRFEMLAKMLGKAGHESEHCAFMRNLANERLEEYGKEPESFTEFFMTTELARFGLHYPDGLLSGAKQKIPLKEAQVPLQLRMLEGIGFGATHPGLTERIWRQTYERLDPESWAEARRAGVDIPEEDTPLPLEEREQQVLATVAYYATEYFPELVDPLGLRLA